jgi:hypothetical protein
VGATTVSYYINVSIELLHLEIPKSDLPVKSDTLVGYERPEIVLPECTVVFPSIEEESFLFHQEGFGYGAYDDDAMIELTQLCKQYKGTLIAKCSGEDGEVWFTRVRDGVEKKVKLVEVEE